MATAVLTACSSKVTTGELSVVPNPVSIEYSGNGVSIDKSTMRPEVEQVIDNSLEMEEYILDATGESGDRITV